MNNFERIINNYLSHYNDKKYWKMKFKLQDNQTSKIIRLLYLYKLKKMDAFNCATLGNRLYGGSKFLEKPHLPHGIKGIFISDNAIIGKNVTIFQQVTIGIKDSKNKEKQIIGDNVIIGAGAKIIGEVTIGNNVKIGANCIVVEDIPDNATVVMNKPRIIIKK